MMLWSFATCVIIPVHCFTMSELDLLVQTSTGPVKGKFVTGFTNKIVRVFLGIPYAQPPVEKLRFRPPMPVTPWTQVFDATTASLPCYQTYSRELMEMSRMLDIVVQRPWSEDCLTLNIWTPTVNETDLPIIVNIHQGQFNSGTGGPAHTDYSTYASEAELIRVTLNYRLGAFGFLSFGTLEYPGNLGIMDQHIALKWIHQNIKKFGGKPTAIFLSGIEAGAASVGHLMIQERNKGLYKTVLLMSGSPTCTWAWQTKDKALRLSKALSRQLGCENTNTSRKIDCLQQVHPEDIVQASLTDDVRSVDQFKPNVDGSYIKENPMESMKAGRFNNNTVLLYSTTQEGSLLLYTLNENIQKKDSDITIDEFNEAIKRSGLVHSDSEVNAIYDWYTNGSKSINATTLRDSAVRAYSDGISRCCSGVFLD